MVRYFYLNRYLYYQNTSTYLNSPDMYLFMPVILSNMGGKVISDKLANKYLFVNITYSTAFSALRSFNEKQFQLQHIEHGNRKRNVCRCREDRLSI